MILHIYEPEVKIERSAPPKNDLIVVLKFDARALEDVRQLAVALARRTRVVKFVA